MVISSAPIARSTCLTSRLLALVALPLTVIGSLVGASTDLEAGDPLLVIYTMNEGGQLSIGGAVLESLKTKYDPSTNPPGAPEQQWVDLAVLGPDRWALRADGTVFQNGKKLHVLPFDITADSPAVWRRLAAASGALYALRADGLIGQDDTADIQYPAYSFTFFDMVAPVLSPFTDGPDVFALRTDGGVFGSTSLTPGMMLVAGAGVNPAPGSSLDGEFFDTTWAALAIDPTTGLVYGLRADGHVYSFDGADFDASSGIDPGAPIVVPPAGPPTGPPLAIEVANFPFPATIAFTLADLYTDIAFDTDGTWYVLRQDGTIFRSDDFVTPLIDLPGDGLDSDEVFVDFGVANGSLFALRFDGKLYGAAGTPIVDLQKKRYRSLELGDTAPDLSNFKNSKPSAVLYRLTLLENEAITLPVLVTDVNKAADQLAIQVDLTSLPGATWDDATRTVSWAGGLAGKYSFTASVDDGLLKKPKVFRYKIRVVPADAVPEKNRPPSPVKVKKVQTLVGIELVMPVFATDRDGDPLKFTVDDQSGIFALGANFDQLTSTITWTPIFDNLGKQTAVVLVSDGIKTKPIKLKFNVVSPLIFD